MVAKTTEQLEASIGAQIKRARIRAGYSQAKLADLASLSLATVQNLERGAGSSLATLIKVARVLKRTDWLLDLAPEAGPSPIDRLRMTRGKPERQRVRASKVKMVQVERHEIADVQRNLNLGI